MLVKGSMNISFFNWEHLEITKNRTVDDEMVSRFNFSLVAYKEKECRKCISFSNAVSEFVIKQVSDFCLI